MREANSHMRERVVFQFTSSRFWGFGLKKVKENNSNVMIVNLFQGWNLLIYFSDTFEVEYGIPSVASSSIKVGVIDISSV